MLTNAIYIATKPRINIVPKMIMSIAECAMNGENYCTFCMQGDREFEKYVERVGKSLEKQGYKSEVYTVVISEEDLFYMYYLRVRWNDGMFNYVEKESGYVN